MQQQPVGQFVTDISGLPFPVVGIVIHNEALLADRKRHGREVFLTVACS